MSGPQAITVDSDGPEQTIAIGRAIGECLIGGEVLGLCGPLGAGKTQFVKGLARGLSIPADEPVQSPTFVLLREYRGRLVLHHCDAYRLGNVDELIGLGLTELIDDGDGVLAIEWADRFPAALPEGAWRIEIEHSGESSRRFRIRVGDGAADARIRAALLGFIGGRSSGGPRENG